MSNPHFETDSNDINKNSLTTTHHPIEQRSEDKQMNKITHSDTISISNDDNKLSNDDQEKEKELDKIDTVQQIQDEIILTPVAPQMVEQKSVCLNKFSFFSKIPFFRKFEKSNQSEGRRLKTFEIYKFADKFDVFLMIIGTLAAIGTGGTSLEGIIRDKIHLFLLFIVLYPLMLAISQKMINILVDLGKLQAHLSATNVSIHDSDLCFILPSNTSNSKSSVQDIQENAKYFVLLGFVSILFYWIACSAWITSAERQVRRIRYLLFRNILHQEIGWFDVHNTGELSSRLVNDLGKKIYFHGSRGRHANSKFRAHLRIYIYQLYVVNIL